MVTTNADKVNKIIGIITDYYNLSLEVISGKEKRRPRSHVWCKHVCMFFVYSKTSLILSEIATYFDSGDHTSVRWGIKNVKNVCKSNKWINEDIRQLGEIIDLELFVCMVE